MIVCKEYHELQNGLKNLIFLKKKKKTKTLETNKEKPESRENGRSRAKGWRRLVWVQATLCCNFREGSEGIYEY